jgi:hypothetical protein
MITVAEFKKLSHEEKYEIMAKLVGKERLDNYYARMAKIFFPPNGVPWWEA